MAKPMSKTAGDLSQQTTDTSTNTGGGGGGIEQTLVQRAPTDNVEQPIAPAVEAAPNSPSFDFDPKSMQPNLRDGEQILALSNKYGFEVFVTTYGRKIFACSFDEYCAKIGPLPYDRTWLAGFFPQAVA